MNWFAAAVTSTNSSRSELTSQKSSKLLKINVGGISFIFMRSVLEKFPETLLGTIANIDDQSLARHTLFDAFIPESGEIYFSRSGTIFHSIAHYYNTGHLHNLHQGCNTSFLEELKFWGIHPKLYTNLKCKECYKKPLKSSHKWSEKFKKDEADDLPNRIVSEEQIEVPVEKAGIVKTDQIDNSLLIPSNETGLENCTTPNGLADDNKLNSNSTYLAKVSSTMSPPKTTTLVSKFAVGAKVSALKIFCQKLKTTGESSDPGGDQGGARAEIWKVLEGSADNQISLVVNILSILFILLNTSLIVLDSIPTYAWTYCGQTWTFTGTGPNDTAVCDAEDSECCSVLTSSDGCESHGRTTLIALYLLSWACTLAFTIEFLMKLWATPNRFKFFKMPITIIDLLAVVPDYIMTIVILTSQDEKSTSFVQTLQVFRVIRVFRIFRIIKLARFEASFHVLGKTFRECMPEFALLFVYLSLSTVIFGTVLYYLEFGVCGTPFISIPRGVYWAVVSFFTFSQATPETDIGKCVAVFSSVFGIVLMAMPVSILVDKFSIILAEERKRKKNVNRSRDSLYDEFGRIQDSHDTPLGNSEKIEQLKLAERRMTSKF